MVQANIPYAHIPYEVCYWLFRKAYKTVALLDGFNVIEVAGKANTHYAHWCGENPKFTNYLCVWGKAGTVKIKTDKTLELANRGVQCVFVGYVLGHLGDTYQMQNPDTNVLEIGTTGACTSSLY
jgi:hypothetical protein